MDGGANVPDTEENDGDDDEAGSTVKINLAGTYTTIIREYARLRRTKGAAANARNVLDMMHEVMEQSEGEGER
eukprot:12433755-Ditylum_brightwellii.AAC.1